MILRTLVIVACELAIRTTSSHRQFVLSQAGYHWPLSVLIRFEN